MNTTRIIARARAILLTPRTEWPVIAAEPDTIGGLYSGYIMIMAAIPAVIVLLTTSVIGVSVPFLGSYRVGMLAGLTTAVLTYVLALIAARLHHHLLQMLALQFTDRVWLPIEAWFRRAARLLPLHSALDPKSKKSLWWISHNISLVMLAGY